MLEIKKIDFLESIQYFYENSFNIGLLDLPKWDFLKKLYEKNNFGNEEKIPKIIHQIWLGSELPEKYKSLTKTWIDIHNGWEYKLWTDKDLSEFGLDNENFKNIKNLGTKSDIFRYHIIFKYGGIYADTDFLCLKSFDGLLNYGFFGCGGVHNEKNEPVIFNGLFGSSPNNPILEKCINSINDNVYHTKNFEDIMKMSGPYYLSDVFFDVTNINSDSIILPLSFCYPLPAVYRHGNYDLNKWIREESLCVHLWEQSWQK
jgi:mannosyltransferase OCH1-like enzyme